MKDSIKNLIEQIEVFRSQGKMISFDAPSTLKDAPADTDIIVYIRGREDSHFFEKWALDYGYACSCLISCGNSLWRIYIKGD
jgi:hypothetical protein